MHANAAYAIFLACEAFQEVSSIVKEYRLNERISTREVRIIDDKGEQLGVMPTVQALQMARERGVDLVEVAPTAVPPVCRLMDYGKFRYEQAKKEKEARKGQHISELREVRFRPGIDEHDLDYKVRRARNLLIEGNKVKLAVVFRGRQMAHPDLGVALLKRVVESLKGAAKIERPPTFEGRFLGMVLIPAVSKPAPKQAKESDTEQAQEATAKEA